MTCKITALGNGTQCSPLLAVNVVFAFADPPGPPRNLQIENLTKTSCTLTWEKPSFDGGSKILGYFIEKSSGYRYELFLLCFALMNKHK